MTNRHDLDTGALYSREHQCYNFKFTGSRDTPITTRRVQPYSHYAGGWPNVSRPFQNRCERHGEENRKPNRAGLHLFERLRLTERTREPVEEHDGRALVGEASANELEHEMVGDESARFKERMHLETKRRAMVDLLTQRMTE